MNLQSWVVGYVEDLVPGGWRNMRLNLEVRRIVHGNEGLPFSNEQLKQITELVVEEIEGRTK